MSCFHFLLYPSISLERQSSRRVARRSARSRWRNRRCVGSRRRAARRRLVVGAEIVFLFFFVLRACFLLVFFPMRRCVVRENEFNYLNNLVFRFLCYQHLGALVEHAPLAVLRVTQV